VRPQADYQQSLGVLGNAARWYPTVLTKSGLMVGLGERRDEVKRLLDDLRAHQVAVVTIGQYLQPTLRHLPVEEYVHPETFDEYREYGERLGFRAVFSGPMVRSSFMAELVRDRSMGSNAGD
jgi:lipoic acid synthetase